jgi:hypothetical protein
MRYAMVKMNFDLAVTVGLQPRKHFQKRTFILFSGKEIGMSKWSSIVIADRIARSASQFAPRFKASKGQGANARFKVVGDQEDQMRSARATTNGSCLEV